MAAKFFLNLTASPTDPVSTSVPRLTNSSSGTVQIKNLGPSTVYLDMVDKTTPTVVTPAGFPLEVGEILTVPSDNSSTLRLGYNVAPGSLASTVSVITDGGVT